MLNLLRAAFWISVVAFFMPGDPTADALTGPARDAAALARDMSAEQSFVAVADVCLDRADLCSAGFNAVDDVQRVAVEGIDALAAVLVTDPAR
jgi:hypothetical protein